MRLKFEILEIQAGSEDDQRTGPFVIVMKGINDMPKVTALFRGQIWNEGVIFFKRKRLA